MSSSEQAEAQAQTLLPTSRAFPLFEVPLGFAEVLPGIYRSAYPIGRCLPFLSQTKNIKTFICLCPTDIRPELLEFAEKMGIKVLGFDVNVNQEPFVAMDEGAVSQAVAAATGSLSAELQSIQMSNATRASHN